MATKQLVTLSGAVEQVNAGIKLLGEWLNVSQYHPIDVMPTPGEIVEVQVEQRDKGVWINSLRIVGASTAALANSSDRERAIARMSALRSAAIYCAHRSAVDESVKSNHIFVLAERMLAWLEKGDG
jgi:hypothetical protein